MARSNENDLTEKLAEGHRKYGDGNFTVQNIGDETNPNWTVVKCEKGIGRHSRRRRYIKTAIKIYKIIRKWAGGSSNLSWDAKKTCYLLITRFCLF